MKVAIFHDYFDKMGGGEKLVVNLAKAMNADLYTGFVDEKNTFDLSGVKLHNFDVRGFPGVRRRINIAKKFDSYKFPTYDVYIFSGVWCIAASHNKPNVLYLHTPMRALYDLKDYFISKANPVTRIALSRFAAYWLPKDRTYMSRFDVIGANSDNVKKRVLKYYGKELYAKTTPVYTGIETSKYKYKKDGDFYLSTARLDPLKRIGMIIDAFRDMPDKKLVISGAGPDEKRLKKLAAGCTNITFLGRVSDAKLLDLFSSCKATIAASVDEDLGLIAIEGHASGKPCVAIKEGGYRETVIEGVNGVFFQNERDLPHAIGKLEKTKWNHKRIQKTASKYDIKVFVATMQTLAEKSMRAAKR